MYGKCKRIFPQNNPNVSKYGSINGRYTIHGSYISMYILYEQIYNTWTVYIYICHGYHIILGMHTCLYKKNPPAAPARSPAWRSVAAPPHWGPRRSPRTRKRSRAAPTSRRGAACPELCPRKLKILSKKHWDFIRFIVSRCFQGKTIRIWPHFSNMIIL